MEDASPPFQDPAFSRDDARQHDELLPQVVVLLAISPGATLSWRLTADTQLRVSGAQIWLTRVRSPYDHWLAPGNELRLLRGERIWVTVEGDRPARLALTSALPRQRGWLGRCLARWASLDFDVFAPRLR